MISDEKIFLTGNATSTDLHDVTFKRRNRSGASKENSLMQNFIEMEKNLNELIGELQKMKEEYASTIADGDASKHNHQKWSQGKIKIPMKVVTF